MSNKENRDEVLQRLLHSLEEPIVLPGPGIHVGVAPAPTVIPVPDSRLEIAGRPELTVFPGEIIFTKAFSDEHTNLIARSRYKPLLRTYRGQHEVQSLEYGNHLNGRQGVLVEYDEDTHWRGTKYLDGKEVSAGLGWTWEAFLYYLGALGIRAGEACEIEEL